MNNEDKAFSEMTLMETVIAEFVIAEFSSKPLTNTDLVHLSRLVELYYNILGKRVALQNGMK